MSETALAIRKKISPARASVVPGGSSLEALLRKTMPRDADEILSMDLLVSGVTLASAGKDEVLASLGAFDLVYPLTGEDDATGICALSSGLVAALIEAQMSGRVSATPAMERTPTRTDGVIAGEVVDRFMATAIETATEEGLLETLPMFGFERSRRVLNLRTVELTLDPQSYRTMKIDLSLGGGAKQGWLTFATPERRNSPGEVRGAGKPIHEHLRQIEAPMRAVLARISVSMERAKALKPGDILGVPLEALRDVQLTCGDDVLVATAHLGQLNGRRAVRLKGGEGMAEKAADVTPGILDPELLGGPMLDVAAIDTSSELLPDLPSGDLSDLPGTDFPDPTGGGLPDLPDIPGADLPDLPGSGLPDLPDAGELPDLPDLPGPPDLPP